MEIQRQSEAFAYRLAMPAPLPQNITFKYHPDDSTIEGTMAEGVFYAPAVSAHIGNDPDHIGYISWFGDDYLDPDEVSMIEVDPHYRRSGVATALFDHAKKMNPKVHHSTDQTDLGHSWSDYEQSRKTKAANTIRCAYEMFKPSTAPEFFPHVDWEDPGDPSEYDDPVLEELRNAWGPLGFSKRKPWVQQGILIGPASPDEKLSDAQRWLRNMGHEFASRISQSEPTTGYLYRGAEHPQEWVDKILKDRSVNLPLSSFSEDPEYAIDYARPNSRPEYSRTKGRPVYFRLAPGAKVMPLFYSAYPDLKKPAVMPGHFVDEALTHGDFDVVGSHIMTPKEMKTDPEGFEWGTDYNEDFADNPPILIDIKHRSLPQRKKLSHNTIRCATVNPYLVDKLNAKFLRWTQGRNLQLDHWPTIERFLKDEYPAVYRGHELGRENAGMLVDYPDKTIHSLGMGDRSPYETGPEAIDRYGYDPAEIAAGMVWLHTKAQSLSGDVPEMDQQRLYDIWNKRKKMQQDYEQRNMMQANTIRCAMDDDYDELYHLTDNPDFALDPDYIPSTLGEEDGPGIYLTDDPGHWAGTNVDKPYVATFRVPAGYDEMFDPDYGHEGSYFVPHDLFDLIELAQVSPRKKLSHNTIRCAEDQGYWGQHRPPGPHYGTPLHDLVHDANGEKLLPSDIYEHPEYYDGYSDKRNWEIARKVRGNPEAIVTMYRSLPQGHTEFNTGDWVSLVPEVARGENLDPEDPSKDLPVIAYDVPAKHLWQNGDSFDEWGYWGPPVQGRVVDAPEPHYSKLLSSNTIRCAANRYLYHHTNRENRDSILQHGLLADHDSTVDLDDPGVMGGSYLTTSNTPQDSDTDVWEVDTTKLLHSPEEDWTTDPFEGEDWYWVAGGVSPHALRLVTARKLLSSNTIRCATSAGTTVSVGSEYGLHMTPSCLISNRAKRHGIPVFLVNEQGDWADCNDPMQIMALGAGFGHKITVHANSPDVEADIADYITQEHG